MSKRLYRAANDDYVAQGYSFATQRDIAEAYLQNPGFGGANIYRTSIECSDDEVADLTDLKMCQLADMLDMKDPGAIGIDEWLPRTPSALDALRERGFLWALVAESFPKGTTTWIWLGNGADDEPELEEL